MSTKSPDIVVLHGGDYGDPGNVLRAAELAPPYSVHGFTDLIDRDNAYNDSLKVTVANSDRLYIEETLLMPGLTKTARLAISVAMSFHPGSSNIWTFVKGDKPVLLSDRLREMRRP